MALASSGNQDPRVVQMDHSWKNISLLWKLISLWKHFYRGEKNNGNRIKDYLALKGSTTSKEQMCSAKIRYKLRISVNSQETNDVCRGGDNGTQ